jgi:hypothetical protein
MFQSSQLSNLFNLTMFIIWRLHVRSSRLSIMINAINLSKLLNHLSIMINAIDLSKLSNRRP